MVRETSGTIAAGVIYDMNIRCV